MRPRPETGDGQRVADRLESDDGIADVSPAPDLSSAGQTSEASVVGRQLELLRYFHQQLATYRAYGAFSCDGSDVVGVSFRCVGDGESNEVEEVIGMVTL